MDLLYWYYIGCMTNISFTLQGFPVEKLKSVALGFFTFLWYKETSSSLILLQLLLPDLAKLRHVNMNYILVFVSVVI